MPLNNNFYGIYKTIWVNTGGFSSTTSIAPYIIQSLGDKTQMNTNFKFFMQGDPRSRLLDIGNISQEFNVQAPILVTPSGNKSVQSTPSTSYNGIRDGLLLLKDMLAKVYGGYGGSINTSIVALPILSKADIKISNSESSISFTLKSDGDPGNTPNVYQLNSGYNSALGLSSGARVAKNYDFTVQFGTLQTYVLDATISFDIETKENNFLGAASQTTVQPPADIANNGIFPDGNTTYTGWQFPFLSVGAIKASASGKAAVSIPGTGTTGAINYNTGNYNLNGASASASFPNAAAVQAASNVGLQTSGQFTIQANSFIVNLWNGFAQSNNVMPTQLVFSQAIIDTANYNFSADNVMTFDFAVKAVYTGA